MLLKQVVHKAHNVNVILKCPEQYKASAAFMHV